MSLFRPSDQFLDYFAQTTALAKVHCRDVKGSAWIVLAGVCAILLLCIPSAKQKYIQGIPFVGGDDDASIKRNRERFVHDSKSMLVEGYKKVNSIQDLVICLQWLFI